MTASYRAELVDARGATLGEGPAWLPSTSELLWIDIVGGHLHVADASGAHLRSTTIGGDIGVALPGEDGLILLGTDQGLSVLDPSGEVTVVSAALADVPDLRFNDGKVGPGGHVHLGTTSYSGQLATGFFGRVAPGAVVVPQIEGVSVSNGLDWTAAGGTLYFIDTMAYRVDAFDYDPSSGELANRREAFALPTEWGYPDGMCIDVDDHLWIAFAGGGCVRRFAPDGTVVAVVEVPVPGTTSCAFGGPDLDTLFITTTKGGVEPDDLAGRFADSGGLYRVRTGHRGRAATRWPRSLLTGAPGSTPLGS